MYIAVTGSRVVSANETNGSEAISHPCMARKKPVSFATDGVTAVKHGML